MEKKYLKNIVQKLTLLGERQFNTEILARKLIEKELKKLGLEYTIQEFNTFVPQNRKASLIVDGKSISAEATSFMSGKIAGNYSIVSSLISSQKFLYEPNINFNPKSRAISRSNHYFAPALAISKRDLPRVMAGKKIEGMVKVLKKKHLSANILIGNIVNPKNIIFCHYDSISTGAVDNASGVALTLDVLRMDPGITTNNLLVIAGNEEISYDEPVYWGHGYRVFEEKYREQLFKSQNIFVLDCIGQTKTQVIKNSPIMMLGFPIRSIRSLSSKIKMLTGDFDNLMTIYHSKADIPDKIDYSELAQTSKKLLKLLK
jgi:hypothetical protein